VFWVFEHSNLGFVLNFGIQIFPLIFLLKMSKYFLLDTTELTYLLTNFFFEKI